MAKVKSTSSKTQHERQLHVIRRVFLYLSLLAAALLFVVGILALWAYNFTGDMVRSELSAQKIYFPEKGTPGFEAETYPDLQQYAGQIVDSPAKAKAYANGYIGRHLENIADGKVYSEVSNDLRKDPTNETLKYQQEQLFKGETLRGMLLTSGYGFGTVGEVAGIVALVALVASVVMVYVAFLLNAHNRAHRR